jgi:phosphoribosylformylglycinamidine cyclo-ligase
MGLAIMSAMAREKSSAARPGAGGKPKPMTYRQAGVNIEAGDEMVESIRGLVKKTFSPRVLGPFGGFAGLFALDYKQKLLRRNYRDPVLVGCCDGVGSKLKLAFMTGRLDTVGIDLVAMNVNDLICTGGEPLFFLDYVAVGRLDPDRMRDIIAGVSAGCVQAGCALLGGETAEMPDFYAPDEFDLAGFAVGVVERGRIIDGSAVRAGDVLIALASSGLHSNGYGLARKAIFERGKLKAADKPPELGGKTVAEELLTPTRIYVKPVASVLGAYKARPPVKALCHITGSGLPGNLPRVLPAGLTARVKRASWTPPPVFDLIARCGPVDELEMFRVFNMGVGFVMVVSAKHAPAIMKRLRDSGERCWVLGKIVPGGPEIEWA